jgi:hypothetical protein
MRFQRVGVWLLVLGVAVLLLGIGSVWAQTLKVTQPNQQLYPEPNFASTPMGPAPQGAEVKMIKESGDWYQVEYQGKQGWLHRQAVAESKPGKMGLPGLLTGGPVKEAKGDEVALAGKGFTAETESGFRQKNPSLNFAQVDQIEAFGVDSAKLQAFIKEGGLNP